MIGDILWNPPADLRQTTEIGRYLTWLRDERDLDFRDYDSLHLWSVTDLEAFWASIWDFYRIRAHTQPTRVLGRRTMPGAEWFPDATLNYAEHLVGGEEDTDRTAVVARSQTRPPFDADVRRAARTGGARPRRAPGAGSEQGRPGRRLPPEHPRDARRVHRHRQPGRDLGHLRTRVRRPQRRRPLRPDRAPRPADRRRLRLPRPLRRSPGGGRDDPLEAPDARAHRPRPLRRRAGRRRDPVGRSAERARDPRVRAGPVRPPPLRPLLERHDRAAQGDRPRPRRTAPRAPQEPGPRLGPQARRAPPVVLHHSLDDVERPRLGAPAARLDRHARRRPGVAGPARAVADRRADEADRDGDGSRPT